ncbi:MAG: hypothetical protein JWO25_2035 [Alphaproteobacteria bacterium]|nr:hypothetical protein [Alphaproteobacteria bacterium]
MGVFDWLTGSKPAPVGVKRQSEKTLRKHLMAVNRPKAPFRLRDGADEGVDLVAEWKIVDARWYEIFAKAGIKRVFKVLMKFDVGKGEVRAVDQEWSVEWRAGTPRLEIAGSAFRGRKWEKSFETVYAFREDGSFGKVYDYRFDTSEMKDPLIEAVHASGWGWRSVAFGKL